MDENLLGYLLNALEPDEHCQVEEYVRTHPEAATKLDRLRQTLAPLSAHAEPPLPPPNLAIGTFALIAEAQCQPLLPPAPPPLPQERGSRDWRWVRRADLLIAASLLLVLASLAAIWIVRIRQEAQVASCQNNLRLWWHALEVYSDKHAQHRFPRVEEKGSQSIAGIFVPLLNDDGLVTPGMSVGCPAVDLQTPPSYGVRELEQLYQNDPNGFQAVAPTLAQDYAYTLGYRENGKLNGLRRDSGDLLPILADRPPLDPSGDSPNHGGRGQNVLYIGGHVRWCSERTVGLELDDIYLSKQGQVEAGVNRTDTVLAPSEATSYSRTCHWTVD